MEFESLLIGDNGPDALLDDSIASTVPEVEDSSHSGKLKS